MLIAVCVTVFRSAFLAFYSASIFFILVVCLLFTFVLCCFSSFLFLLYCSHRFDVFFTLCGTKQHFFFVFSRAELFLFIFDMMLLCNVVFSSFNHVNIRLIISPHFYFRDLSIAGDEYRRNFDHHQRHPVCCRLREGQGEPHPLLSIPTSFLQLLHSYVLPTLPLSPYSSYTCYIRILVATRTFFLALRHAHSASFL